MNVTDRIKYAEQRIKELQLLIHHWKEDEKQKQVRETRAMS